MLCSLAYLAFRVVIGGIFTVKGYTKLFGGPGKSVPPVVERYLGAGFVEQLNQGASPGSRPRFKDWGFLSRVSWPGCRAWSNSVGASS
jgi:hypothetical protein